MSLETLGRRPSTTGWRGYNHTTRTRARTWRLEIRALTLKTHDAGSVTTWVHLPPSHPNWQYVAITGQEWTVLRHITKNNVSRYNQCCRQETARTMARQSNTRPGWWKAQRETCTQSMKKNQNSRWQSKIGKNKMEK